MINPLELLVLFLVVCNIDTTVGQFVDALGTSIISGLWMMVLLFWINWISFRKFLTSWQATPDDVSETFHVAHQVQKDISAAVPVGDKELFSVACVSGSIALTPEVLLSTNVFVYIEEFSDSEQSHLTWEVGRACWCCYNPNGVCDGRDGPVTFSEAAHHSCH
jgi:hypothetical protein